MTGASKWGLGASGAYILFGGALFYYATHCTETYCGLVALVAGLPWLLFLDLIGGDSYNAGTFVGIGTVVLNGVLLYLLFAWIEKRVKRSK